MRIPVIALDRVLHIGTLSPSDVGRNSGTGSQEGRCLSVSLCPIAWRSIARLGGYSLHELTRRGGTFVDVHAVQDDPELLECVLEWAQEKGLIERQALWKAWSYDDEYEGWRYVLCASKQSAFEEADMGGEYDDPNDIPGPDDGPGLEPVTVPVGTTALRDLTGMECAPTDDGTDAAIMAWAMEQVPELLGRPVDGVWWRETYDPDCLSAPRGAVFPTRILNWTARDLDWKRVDDENEMEAMPATVFEPMVAPSTPSYR